MLVSLQEYRLFAHDLDSFDGEVLTVLGYAQEECERIADRKFEVDTYYPVQPPADPVYWWEPGSFDNPDTSLTTTVTLVEGYTTAPVGLKRLIAKVAYLLLTASEWQRIPTDIELGGEAYQTSAPSETRSIVSGGRRPILADVMTDSQLYKEIRQWRRGGE